MRSLVLEREINAAAHHAEVIVRTVDKVPAEIIDPADVRREADFDASADLADCLCLRICMTLCLDNVEAFPRFSNKHILARLPRINCPAFNSDTDITPEKVFQVDTTAPGVVGFHVAVILPLVSGEHVSSPKSDIKFSVCVPFRTRRRASHLLHLFSGIGFRTGKAKRADCCDTQQAQYQFFHFISPFWLSLP